MSEPIIGHVEVAPAADLRASITPIVAPNRVISSSVELWARQKRTPAWLLKAAAVGARWQIGEEFDPCLVTEAEFDAAVSFAANPHAHVNPERK